MNKQRRKINNSIIEQLDNIKNILTDLLDQESDAFENLTDGLKATVRGEQMENNISEMEEAIDHLSDAIENLENVD